MAKWLLGGVAATVVALMLMALPIRAQLPTISDVNRGGDAPAAGPLPDWDVAVLKPHPAEDPGMSWRMTADGLSLVNLPLEQMICSAWDLKPYQVSGLNGWMKSSTFDLTAKVSGNDVAAYKKLNVAQRREMLQKLLTERFQLKVHMETKTLPVYDLVVDKSGSKLKVSTAIEAPSAEEWKANPDKYKKGSMSMGPGMFEGSGVPVRSLTSQLGNALGKPVHDATGLTGVYDITLHFRPEEAAAGSDDNADVPSVFSAVQEQLGLKLVPGKGPVQTLVVDAAQKPEAD
ncbi:TIGR03435 family protein [Granulicella sp. S156]|uniref:TIGR03435 family protein n=1 Tax=Granulicella sp. S156 TaxID=1747224 RepID=UPI00131AAF05|nr:TIGR03435 family protein [Granulicella sp. S156]